MVKIRLRRTGAKKKPHYRVVVTDIRAPRDGRFIEILGHYNPRTDPVTFEVHEDRVLHWLSVGAQPTDPVKRLLQNMGTLDKFARLKEGAALEELLAEASPAQEGDGDDTESVVDQQVSDGETVIADTHAEEEEAEEIAVEVKSEN